MQKNIWIAAKYLRLSIEDGDKAESESIVNQSILIDNYMKSTSDITIVETFKDDGFSGTDFKRPGFQAMLKAIENKEINCIIVKDLSRFGREHIDVDRYIQKVFPQLGVRFIAINDNYDSETANITDTHLVLPVKSFVNDTYCRQNSQKVRSHLSAKRNIGEYVGNYVSYGYKKCDADKSQIEIDPVAAKHVRDIFNWKMEGMSNQLIADKLNELGVLAPADYKRATGVNFKSSFQTHLTSRWSAVAIIRILKNPIYYGVLQQGKSQRINYKVKVQRALPKEEWVIFENHHEGIVTKEEYEIMKEHTVIGEKMLKSLELYQDEPLVKTACEIGRWHHERYDGKGYPDGLKGDEIPISAQIVSIADVYDALVSERVYKKAFSHKKAMEMILNGECGAFNPLLLECLVEIQDRIKTELDGSGSVKKETYKKTIQEIERDMNINTL